MKHPRRGHDYASRDQHLRQEDPQRDGGRENVVFLLGERNGFVVEGLLDFLLGEDLEKWVYPPAARNGTFHPGLFTKRAQVK